MTVAETVKIIITRFWTSIIHRHSLTSFSCVKATDPENLRTKKKRFVFLSIFRAFSVSMIFGFIFQSPEYTLECMKVWQRTDKRSENNIREPRHQERRRDVGKTRLSGETTSSLDSRWRLERAKGRLYCGYLWTLKCKTCIYQENIKLCPGVDTNVYRQHRNVQNYLPWRRATFVLEKKKQTNGE